MFTTDEIVKAAVQTRNAEADRLVLLREARATRRGKANRGWRWRIEPGMEESFRYLLGWVIPGRGGDENTAPSSDSKAA